MANVIVLRTTEVGRGQITKDLVGSVQGVKFNPGGWGTEVCILGRWLLAALWKMGRWPRERVMRERGREPAQYIVDMA